MLAEGWTECWGIYDYRSGRWLDRDLVLSTCETKRFDGESYAVARSHVVHANLSVRRFWRRKKRRSFKVGDEVLVRGTVRSIDPKDSTLDLGVAIGGRTHWVGSRDVSKRRS